MRSKIDAYPWHRVEQVSRAQVDGRRAARPGTVRLAELGRLPIGLRCVVGRAGESRQVIESLRQGDIWSCGRGWWIDAAMSGFGGLATSYGERGILVEFSKSGTLMVTGDVMEISADDETLEIEALPAEGEEVLLSAPVMVRVELGAVCMEAREWAQLRPGDVISTGKRVEESAVLRIAGREVAWGDLVQVDGEVGVRIAGFSGRNRERLAR